MAHQKRRSKRAFAELPIHHDVVQRKLRPLIDAWPETHPLAGYQPLLRAIRKTRADYPTPGGGCGLYLEPKFPGAESTLRAAKVPKRGYVGVAYVKGWTAALWLSSAGNLLPEDKAEALGFAAQVVGAPRMTFASNTPALLKRLRAAQEAMKVYGALMRQAFPGLENEDARRADSSEWAAKERSRLERFEAETRSSEAANAWLERVLVTAMQEDVMLAGFELRYSTDERLIRVVRL